MSELIISSIGFVGLLALFAIGAVGALLWRNHDAIANGWGGFWAIVGSVWGLIFSGTILLTGRNLAVVFKSVMPELLSASVNIDGLSAFFIFIISLIALLCSIYGLGYAKHFYKQYSLGSLGFFYNLFIAGMILVVTASNGIFFLIAWEIMSVASYFLVSYERHNSRNVKAGYLYLIMTHVGTAFIILGFLLLYKFTGSFDFAAIKLGAAAIPSVIKDVVFVLAVLGFGTKAGIIPVHIWLPSAHPAAPSHVSGLMSGVMIKTGIYMMIRIFLIMLQPIPVWWGLVILIIGSISALLGVLYALTEHDLKRLLAYHSIENIGIILLGLGSAMTFYALGWPSLALLGLIAALFHTLNHAIFKTLLFLSAGSVINQTHTRNMEEYGGLIKYMPYTAFCFLIGAVAISALPPFNGFFSEWLTFQGLFQGVAVLSTGVKWIFILAASSLAFTGGLALACFVKAFGITFLARPRSKEISHAHESSISLRLGMGALAVLALAVGLLAAPITTRLENISRGLAIFQETPSFVVATANQGLVAGSFSAISGLVLFVVFIILLFVVWLIVKYAVYGKQKVQTVATWDCGTNLKPRMEITATGFARSIVTIFKGVLKPSIQQEVEYRDVDSRYSPSSRTVTLKVQDIYRLYFYRPLSKSLSALSVKVKGIQGGNVNVYILYIFVALLVLLFFVK